MTIPKRWVRVAVLVLLAVQALQVVVVVHRESLTFDEADHMFAGYMMWKTGDFGLNPEHPPLVKLLATLPIAAKDLWIPPLQGREFKIEAYLSGRDWFARNDGGSQRLVFRVRLMAGLLALGLSLAVFFTAREFFGDTAALVALVLVTLDPNVLAHSALVTTDVGVSLFFLLSVYAFYRFVKQPSLLRLGIAGAGAGLLIATKHSGILLAPMLALLIVWEIVYAPRGTRTQVAARLAGGFAAIVMIGSLVLWAFYGFRYAARPPGLPFPTVAEYVKPLSHFNGAAVMFFSNLHLLPQSWLIGLVDVKRMAEYYPTFALGKVYAHGIWWYFPIVILVKTTLGLLALVALALLAIFTGRVRKGRELVYLLVPSVFYLLVAILAGMDIGARHILPADTFMFVLAAGGVAAWAAAGKPWAWAGGALVAAHVLSSLTVFPNYMAYANEAWGGPKNVHNLLSDANVDWAQQLYQVKAWQDRHPGEECWFAYFAYPEIDPATYGITCRHLPSADTFWLGGSDITPPVVHGSVLISAGDLSGCEWTSDRDNPYLGFEHAQPAEVIDHAVFVYRGDLDTKDAATLSRVQNAYQLLGGGKPPEALALVREAVSIDPGDIRSQTALGNVAAAMGLKDEARHAWEAASAVARQLKVEDQAAVLPELEEKLKKL